MTGTRPVMTDVVNGRIMGFNCGIVGLPNVGKSALFNALTATQAAEATKYPFSTREPHIGRVAVPDERLAVCARLAKSAKTIPTQLEFVDITGLVRGASKGQGLGNQFLGHLREVDAIAHIVRCFEDDHVVHGEGTVVISAAIKAVLAVLADPAERAEFLTALGLGETGLDQVIRTGYTLLDLITFLTAGPKEARAWTIPPGTKAPQAARVIHSDFEKGFIRAETIAYADFVAWGGEQGAKDAGKMRLEGADYV